jgi:hypothetical protein
MTIPPILHQNCHLILQHPAVNAGEDCGFLLREDPSQPGGLVSVQRERSSDGALVVRVFFEVLLADNLLTPQGETCPWTRAEMYAHLLAFLDQCEGIRLTCAAGVFEDLGAIGHAATGLHSVDESRVACQLNHNGVYFPPVPLVEYQAALWDGERAWGASWWR